MKDVTICSKCVMDTTVLNISFDENGVCNFCKDYIHRITKDLYTGDEAKNRLESLVKRIKERGKNNEYDCLIGVSGGVDSTYVAYLVKKVYGLRPLAIHLDNGWNSELSVANVEQIVKRLGIDLYTHVLDWEQFRDIQVAFLRSGISNIEIPTDHAIWAVLVKTAARYGIRYIIAGNNIVTESIMPASWLYGSKDARLIEGIHATFGKEKLKGFPRLALYDYINYFLVKGIRWIPILNYVQYIKKEAKQIITDELGWRDYGGKHYESIFTRFFHAYYLPEKFGYDLRRSYLSALILSGQITREDALTELESPPSPAEQLKSDREYVIKKLRLSDIEFEEIMNSPKKTFRDYPNNDGIWRRFNGLVSAARQRIIRVN
ncbi:MAG: N-acetyl sugar amidotransferase [Ignavibacteriaceae bacterium]|jgi:N-acetyl sugar amidotransferase|nr:N-acetyl sugar amidotransferase [Ignavibacteriaceae bacterium]